jgi:hypothetical protein
MANVSRIRGFVPAKSLIGAPWQSLVRQYEVNGTQTTAIFIGDAVTLQADGSIAQAATSDTILGVVVGLGSQGDMFDQAGGYFNANDLGKRHLTSTDTGIAGILPAEGALFEVFDNGVDLDLAVGALADIDAGTGSTITGNSDMALVANVNGDVKVVEHNTSPKNDRTLQDAQYIVKFQTTTNTL